MKEIPVTLFLATGIVVGQVYTPPKPGQGNSGTPTDTTTVVRSNEKESKSPFGEEIPMLDPGSETITVGGITIPLGDNRIMRARFEKYLAQPEEDSDAAREYRATIDQILSEVSPYRKGGPNLKEGWRLLPRAATFPADSRICLSLAEAVYTAMLARQDNKNLHKINAALEEEKQKKIRDGDWKTRHDRDDKIGNTNATGQGSSDKNKQNKQATQTGRGANSLEYAEILRCLAEVEVMKKKNIAQSEVQVLQTKILKIVR